MSMSSTFGQKPLAVLFVAILSSAVFSQGKALQGQDATAQIKTLRKERAELLDKVVKKMTDMYAVGAVSLEMLIKTEDQALQAQLELAESPEERTGVLRKLVENAKKSIQLAENHAKAGIGQDYEVLQAKAHLLKIRIDLVKEEGKFKPANPKEK